MNHTFKPMLLPYYFKKIGFAYLILVGTLMICEKAFSIPIWEYIFLKKEIFETYSENMMLLSLHFVAMSKEKIEDEMTTHVRLNIMSSAFQMFCAAGIFVLFNNTFDGTEITKVSRHRVIAFMLCVYLGTFYWYQWQAKREEKKSENIEA